MRLVTTDTFDEDNWVMAQADCVDLERLVNRAETCSRDTNQQEAMIDLLADQYQMLMQPVPAYIQTQHLTLHEYLLTEIAETKEFKTLRGYAQEDLANAAVGAAIMGETLLDHALREPLITQQLTLEHMDPTTPFDPMAFEAAVELVRRVTRAAAQEATEVIEDIILAVAMFGEGGDDPFEKSMSIESKLKLADKMEHNKKFRRIVEMAGRFQRIALAKRASVVREVPQLPTDIGIGSNVARCLSSELVLAALPQTAPIFYEKVASGKLLQFEFTAQEELGGGAIVLLVDDSGSMRGEPEGWAKALTLAFLAVGQREKRDVLVRKFGGNGQHRDYSFRYRTAEKTVDKTQMMEMVDRFESYDDTEFEEHLLWASKQIEKPDHPWEKADIVLITDGNAHMSDAFTKKFNEARRTLDFQTFGIFVGHYGSVGSATLAPVLDQSLVLADLDEDASENTLAMLFAS